MRTVLEIKDTVSPLGEVTEWPLGAWRSYSSCGQTGHSTPFLSHHSSSSSLVFPSPSPGLRPASQCPAQTDHSPLDAQLSLHNSFSSPGNHWHRTGHGDTHTLPGGNSFVSALTSGSAERQPPLYVPEENTHLGVLISSY